MKRHISGRFKIEDMQLNFLLGTSLKSYYLYPFYLLLILFRLLGLQISTDIMWKIEQLKFMLEHAFFTNANEKYHISHELAGVFHIYTT